MSRALVIKLQSASALAIAIRDAPGAVPIEAAVRVPLTAGEDVQAAGQRLREAIAPLSPGGRTPTVVVIPRSELYWQSIDLPPSPLEDLPDLVHLQAQRDLPLADDGSGFDFVPLEGDETHPHRVLGVGVSPQQFERIRRLCDSADLKIDRLVPEPFGWLEVGKRADDDLPPGNASIVFAAMAERQAGVWATENETLRLLRTIWLPAEADPDADAATLASELRRTLISLVQHRSAPAGASRVVPDPGALASTQLPCFYVGDNATSVAARLAGILHREIRGVPLESLIDAHAIGGVASLSELAPLVGLGIAAAQRRAPLADLLHPRRGPAPPSRRRAYALTGAAGALVALLLGWQAYRNISGPLEAAAAADSQRAALARELEVLGKDELRATAIEAWLAQSLNVLSALDDLGQQLRPQPLDSKEFKVEEDLVVTKLAIVNRQLTLDASARTSGALQPAENRLRAANYRVDRNAVDSEAKAVPGYTVSASAILEPGAGGASAAPKESAEGKR